MIHSDFNKIIYFNKTLKENKINLFQRTTRLYTEEHLKKFYLTGLCIKGKDASGFVGKWSIEDLWAIQKKLTPNASLIPYGGVATSEQVKYFLNDGAEIIGVGARFAFSKESPISDKAKYKIINNNISNISLNNGQNTLFINNDNTNDIRTDPNNTKELELGLFSSKDEGKLYIGKSIDQINKIMSCKEIIDDLLQDLKLDT